MGGKAPSIEVPPVAAAPVAAKDNAPNVTNQADGQTSDSLDKDAIEKANAMAKARAAASQTILTDPLGISSAAQIGKAKLGA